MEMHNKIKELTEKIQREGLEKANKEAGEIIGEAQKKAEKIVNDAKKEAEKIQEESKKSSKDFSEKMKSEVRMSQQQALAGFKKEITELIQANVVDEPVKSSLDDKKFMQKLIESVVKNWKDSDEDSGLQILLSKEDLKDAEDYFKEKVNSMLSKGLVIKEYPGIKKGFEIQPEEGNYKISMTDEAFEQFIRDHFKPKTVEFLFGGEDK